MKKINGKPTSALDELRGLWEQGEYRKALRLAARWPRLGSYRNAIRSGWLAASNARFTREIGKDPDALVADGLRAISERYSLPLPLRVDCHIDENTLPGCVAARGSFVGAPPTHGEGCRCLALPLETTL